MVDALASLFNSFFAICRFRLGPQDLPSSQFLLAMALTVYVLLSTTIAAVQLPFQNALMVGILNTTLMTGFTIVILQSIGRSERLIQTLTALAGASIVLGLFGLPIVIWLHSVGDDLTRAKIPAFLWFVLFFWDLAITAHIFRHALSTRFALGFLIASIYTVLLFMVVNASLPAGLAG